MSLARDLLAYLHAVFGVLALLNLGILVPLIVAWCNMVLVASCKQQHEHLIVAWEFHISPSHLLLYCCHSLQCVNNKNDCYIVNVVVMALRSILLLAVHAFTIVDVVDPHQSKRLVAAGAILHAYCNQPWLMLPAIRQRK